MAGVPLAVTIALCIGRAVVCAAVGHRARRSSASLCVPCLPGTSDVCTWSGLLWRAGVPQRLCSLRLLNLFCCLVDSFIDCSAVMCVYVNPLPWHRMS